MDSRHGSQGRVATPPDHGRHYGARMAIHPDKRTDLEQRKRELGKEPDWGAYQAVERQTEIGIYSTGVPRTRNKRVPDKTPKMDQVKVNYGLAPKKRTGTMLPELQEYAPESPGTDQGTKLPALAMLTPEQEANEARPFRPPPTPERKDMTVDESMATQYRRLKYDLASLKHKASAEIEMAHSANAKLQKKLASQRDLLDRQSSEIRDLTFQLKEMRRMQQSEVKQETKKVTHSEKRAATLHRKLGDLSHEHEVAMTAASAAMQELQNERDAMAMGLAAVATQALGGEEADPQAVSLEVDASVKEGNDPLPRTPQSWLHFKYIDVSEQANSLRHRKLSGDGVRAVAALVAQVRRLWRKRLELGADKQDMHHEVEKLTHIIQKVDVEYQAISDTVSLIERAAEKLRETRGMDIPLVQDGTLPERLKTVQAVLHHIAMELDVKERELGKASVRLLEMDFYGKLHGMDNTLPAAAGGDLPDLSAFSEEEQARIVKMQAVGRGYIARKEVEAKKAAAAGPVEVPAAAAAAAAQREEELPSLTFSEEEQARIVKIQAAGRGLLSRRSAKAAELAADAAPTPPRSDLPDLSKFSEEEQAKIVKMQAVGRGYIARKEVEAKKAASTVACGSFQEAEAEAAPAGGDSLPDLSKFSEEEQAKIVKMQAVGRGYIARKGVEAKKSAAASGSAEESKAVPAGSDDLPDLSKFSEEEQAKIIKMQAAGRGYIARKEVEAKKAAASGSAEESKAVPAGSDDLPDLSKFSEEEQAKIIKMQAAGRGYIARKEVEAKKAAASGSAEESKAVPAGSDDLPDLSKFSEEEQAKIVKMQAAGRGYIARKEVEAKKAAASGSAERAPKAAPAGADDLPDLSKFSEEEQAKIIKMQAAGRGYIARKEVEAKKSAAASGSAEESKAVPAGADDLPDLSKFSEEEQAKIVKMQAAGRGYIARKEVEAKKSAAAVLAYGAGAEGAAGGGDDLPDLSKFSEEEQARIVKMQAVGRGYIARKEVEAKRGALSADLPGQDLVDEDPAEMVLDAPGVTEDGEAEAPVEVPADDTGIDYGDLLDDDVGSLPDELPPQTLE